jgi:hypothetical protein
MGLTTGAWIGIGVGLAIAAVNYVFVLYVMRHAPQKLDEAKMRSMKALLALGFIVFGFAGYVVGDMYVDQGVLPR